MTASEKEILRLKNIYFIRKKYTDTIDGYLFHVSWFLDSDNHVCRSVGLTACQSIAAMASRQKI